MTTKEPEKRKLGRPLGSSTGRAKVYLATRVDPDQFERLRGLTTHDLSDTVRRVLAAGLPIIEASMSHPPRDKLVRTAKAK